MKPKNKFQKECLDDVPSQFKHRSRDDKDSGKDSGKDEGKGDGGGDDDKDKDEEEGINILWKSF